MNFDPVYSIDDTADSILKKYIDLTKAIRSRDKTLIEKLLNDNAPVNHHLSNHYNLTPLHLVVQSRSLEIAKILLDKGADTNVKNVLGETPLILAAKTESTVLIDLLLSYDVRNQEDVNHLSHLHIACMRNRVDVVQKLLSMNQGDNLNKPVGRSSVFWQGYTPLHFAVRYGCIETVKYLLQCEADLIVEDSRNMTPLHLADSQRNEEIIDLLLAAHKSEFNNPSNMQGLTHFHIACTRDDPSAVEHFLKLGVNVNLKMYERYNDPRSGWEPIHFAMYYECPEVTKILLRSGVNLQSALSSKLLKSRLLLGCHTFYKESIVSMDTSSEKHEEISRLDPICLQKFAVESSLIQAMSWNSGVNVVPDFNVPMWTGSTLLHLLVKNKSADVTEYIMDHGADPMIQDSNCRTPLHTAFHCRSRESVKLIVKKLKNGIQNLVDNDGLSIFHILCTTNNLPIIQNLLDSGVDINAQVLEVSGFWAGFTPLHFACMYLQPEVVKLLLDNHADIRITNRSNSNPFDFLVDKMATDLPTNHEKYFQILGKLIIASSSLGADQTINTRGISILHSLCCCKYVESTNLLRQCLETNQNEINGTIELREKHTYNGCTPLHLAMKFGNLDKAELMLEHGSDPLMINSEGKTPLEYACLNGLQLNLLAKHAKSLVSFKIINQTSSPGHFHIACCVSHSQVLKDVLEVSDENTKKILVNRRNDEGQTPLHSMIAREIPMNKTSRIDRMYILLENGASPNSRDYELRTPLHFAHRFGGLEVVRLLIAYGADVNLRDLYGITPWFQFCEMNNEECMDLLLKRGADINMKDREGQTCLTKKFPASSSEPPSLAYRLIFDENEDKCIVLLLKHIKKLQLIGWYVSEENVRAYDQAKTKHIDKMFDEVSFARECEKELETMKTLKVDHYTTIRDLLSKNLNKMSYHSENDDLRETLLSDEFYEKYPIYGYLVEVKFNDGVLRRHLLSKTKKLLNFLNELSLPQVCLDMILEHLNNEDLQNIIYGAE